ncbi:MAG: sulfite exporter TauE/SafE family protein [Candidatus Omnitrophica bacterium]|nr:sulfite exporter TauE/SafE family protein [Candidatus Omnitrophota bacterium]
MNPETFAHFSLLSYVSVFLAGVAMSFTPCVYPILPVTVAFIGGKSQGSRLKGFSLSVMYVFGMSLTYASLGAFAALTGSLFGQISTHPLTFFIVGNMLLLFGLSMLDVFVLPLPHRVFRFDGSGKKGDMLTTFLMGVASGFIIGPCTAPVLGALLIFVGTHQNVLYGMTLLFTFAYGMGIMLIIVGTFIGVLTNLPRSGQWMGRIKKGFGWAMIAIAEYFFIQSGRLLI